MAKDKAAGVVDALNEVYVPILTFFELAHRYEHRFADKYRYNKLAKRYDMLVHAARCWRRHVLDRIERLGGDADSMLEKIVIVDDVKGAYEGTHEALRAIFDAINKAVDAAKVADDHPTHKLLLRLQTKVDHKMFKLEAWLRQVADLKASYLVTVV